MFDNHYILFKWLEFQNILQKADIKECEIK